MTGPAASRPGGRTPEEATSVVRRLALEVGFDDVGVARADAPLFGVEEVAAAAETGRLSALPWLEASAAPRTDIGTFLPGARSVVVVVLNYFRGDHADHVPPSLLEEGARVSRYAWGGDYHNAIRKRLRKLRKRLLAELGPEHAWAPFNDVDAVLERAWAQAAELGFIGKSTLFIHRGLGTWTFLGGLATTAELAPTSSPRPATDLCGTCMRCLEACPTGALLAPHTLDVGRCLTTWSIERPFDDPPEEARDGHGWAAGCDLCQEVCPWNRFERQSPHERFAPRPGLAVLHPGALPDDEALVGTPLARPGAAGLARTVARALGSARSEPAGEGAKRRS